jgi:Peroxisome biogenesis factor 1, N-terminal
MHQPPFRSSKKYFSRATTFFIFFFFSIVETNVDGYIDIPECLLTENAEVTGMDTRSIFVIVQPLECIDSASELFVDPRTFDDWELLQSNAVALEEGRLLQQISVVYSGQVIHLSMPNGTSASLVILPQNFESNETSIWPKDAAAGISSKITSSPRRRQRYPCYRLMADTQIIITPKPRPSIQPIEYPILQLIATRQDYEMIDPAMILLSKKLQLDLVSVPQGSMILHPKALARMRTEYKHTTTNASERELLFAVVVRVIPTSSSQQSSNNKNENYNDEGEISVTVQIISSSTVPENHAGTYVTCVPFVFEEYMSMTIVYHANSDCSSCKLRA